MTISSTSRQLPHCSFIQAFRRCAHDEQGQSVVEAALSMFAMLILIFGVIESSWAIYCDHYLGNVAHEATRYAIVRGGSWASSCSGYASSQCTASPTDIANFVANNNFPGINITASEVCVQYFSSVPSATSSSCSANSSPKAPGNIVQVTINHPFVLTVPGLPQITWNLASTSQMVIAQ